MLIDGRSLLDEDRFDEEETCFLVLNSKLCPPSYVFGINVMNMLIRQLHIDFIRNPVKPSLSKHL